MISYRDLLDHFWSGHNPCRPAWSRQYMSAIFTGDDEQQRVAEETARDVALERGADVATLIEPLRAFYLAEAYHQKYSLRRRAKATAEFEAIYPDLDDFVRSTAVTRANALAAGALDAESIGDLADEIGLSEGALEELRTGR